MSDLHSHTTYAFTKVLQSSPRAQSSRKRAKREHPQRISLPSTNLSKTTLLATALVQGSAEKALNCNAL